MAAGLQGASARRLERSSLRCAQALTLLEYLVKNGSERVVDDARQHLSLIKILRNFHYIDEKGKDQGINGALFMACCGQGIHQDVVQSAIVRRNWPSCCRI
jgi:epsin